MPDIAIVFMFRSDSDPKKVYQTLQYTDGTTSCDCPGWTRRKERTCKHTRFVLAGIAPEVAISVKRIEGRSIRIPNDSSRNIAAMPDERSFDFS